MPHPFWVIRELRKQTQHRAHQSSLRIVTYQRIRPSASPKNDYIALPYIHLSGLSDSRVAQAHACYMRSSRAACAAFSTPLRMVRFEIAQLVISPSSSNTSGFGSSRAKKWFKKYPTIGSVDWLAHFPLLDSQTRKFQSPSRGYNYHLT